MPRKYDDVLGYSPEEGVFYGSYQGIKYNGIDLWNGNLEKSKITHWMPLPPSPMENKTETRCHSCGIFCEPCEIAKLLKKSNSQMVKEWKKWEYKLLNSEAQKFPNYTMESKLDVE